VCSLGGSPLLVLYGSCVPNTEEERHPSKEDKTISEPGEADFIDGSTGEWATRQEQPECREPTRVVTVATEHGPSAKDKQKSSEDLSLAKHGQSEQQRECGDAEVGCQQTPQ
jgi:hypothetical protein